MTDEQLIRQEMARGNDYLAVVNYAIRLLNRCGLHKEASYVVSARNATTQQIAERYGK